PLLHRSAALISYQHTNNNKDPAMLRSALVASLLLFSTSALSAIPAQVELTTGTIEGAAGRNEGLMVYKGIPYAASPVGENRWRAPQAVPSWDGVRPATAFGPQC